MKVLADSAPGNSPFLACRGPPSHCTLPWPFTSTCTERKGREERRRDGRSTEGGVGRERETEVSAFFMREGPTLMTSSKLTTSQRSHLQIPSHQAFRASTYKFWGDTNIQSIPPRVLGTCSNLSESPSISIALHAL